MRRRTHLSVAGATLAAAAGCTAPTRPMVNGRPIRWHHTDRRTVASSGDVERPGRVTFTVEYADGGGLDCRNDWRIFRRTEGGRQVVCGSGPVNSCNQGTRESQFTYELVVESDGRYDFPRTRDRSLRKYDETIEPGRYAFLYVTNPETDYLGVGVPFDVG